MPRQRPEAVSQLVTAAQLADLLGYHRHTITESWVPRGCPVEQQADREAGKTWLFRPSKVVEWLVDTNGGQDAGALPTKAESDARNALAAAARSEMLLARDRGELVELSAVKGVVAKEYAKVRSRVLSSAPEIAAKTFRLTDRDAVERIAREVLLDTLTALSGAEGFTVDTPDDEDEEEDEDKS